MSKRFLNLVVGFVRRETDAAVQLGFKIPDQSKVNFEFDPGQYITLKLNIDGKSYRRAYSICSPIKADMISVLVKQLDGGKVSTYLNKQVKTGDKIDVMVPGGSFKVSLSSATTAGSYILIGAGSGITPLMSMIESILQSDIKDKCYLLYGNRDEDNIIFKSKLDRLTLVYPDRLFVTHIISRPKSQKPKGVLNFLSTSKQIWKGKTGRINQAHIDEFLSIKNIESIKGYFICGPGKMIESSVAALSKRGVDEGLVHREYFTSADLGSSKVVVDDTSDEPKEERSAIVTLDGVKTQLTLTEDNNIVQAMMDSGVEPPYSCLSGTCSTCKAKLTKGEVKMDVNIGLEEDEEEAGYILTCQSSPTSKHIELTYDID